jgi:hypothetical protein
VDEPHISEEEHQLALAETIDYEWIAMAVVFASTDVADDIAELIERMLDESPPADVLARKRLQLLLDAFHDIR